MKFSMVHIFLIDWCALKRIYKFVYVIFEKKKSEIW